MPPDPTAVLEYWLGDAAHDPRAVSKRTRLWYSSDPDDTIRRRFGRWLTLAEENDLADWRESPRGSLAEIILLDQFTRNLNRGNPEAFRNDARALDLAESCIEHGQHERLPIMGRVFLYHPFHHAESIVSQDRAVQLFRSLHEAVPGDWQPAVKGFLDYAIGHRDIIYRFGRFPHRNEALGRTSTPDEIEYLQRNHRRYGQ